MCNAASLSIFSLQFLLSRFYIVVYYHVLLLYILYIIRFLCDKMAFCLKTLQISGKTA